MKALICGAGISGLTLAWHLERAGWQVELVERGPAFRDGGYLVDFYGAGYDAAERMGLTARLAALHHRITELGYLDGQGRQVSRFALPPSFDRMVTVLRGDLARTIADRVAAPIRYATTVESVDQHDEQVTVGLTGGERRTVDLLVGADGAHSRVRELAFGPERRYRRYLGHHVAAAVIDDPGLSGELGLGYRMLTVPGLMAGACALDGDRLTLLFLCREPDPAPPADPREALRRRFGGLGWILPDVLPRLPADLYYDQAVQIEMDSWSNGRVVLVGDACQAVSLFAGYGSSLGVAGPWVLADELAAGDVPAALIRYERRVRPVAVQAQAFGRRFIKWMAPSTRLRITLRDLMLRLTMLPGADRLFLNSLASAGRDLVGGGASGHHARTG